MQRIIGHIRVLSKEESNRNILIEGNILTLSVLLIFKRTFNCGKIHITLIHHVTIFKSTFSSVKYIHIVVQPVSKTFSS